MYQKALSIYYSLAMIVVGTAFFVMSPSNVPELTNWQNGIKHQIGVAWQQTMGDQPWFDELAFVYDTVGNFYDQSSTATIAMFQDSSADADIAYIYSQVYNTFAQALHPHDTNTIAYKNIELPPMPGNFMSQDPIYNLVPYRTVVKTIDYGQVAGTSVSKSEDNQTAVNSKNEPWVTIQDNSTGQLYCLAIYNGTVNKYLGPCKYDDYY